VSRIVCATSAGEASRVLHIAAFQRAAEMDALLIFLHVLEGPDFDEQPARMQAAIKTEMEWLLHALVRVARDRSEATEVNTDVVVRTGDAREEILAFVRESDPQLLMLGVPGAGSGFDDVLESVEALGVRVELVPTQPPE
jgi:nucleotide-binding universal stress UspA family protein